MIRNFLFPMLFILSVLGASIANSAPISNNPDDYDVPKYQRIYDEWSRRLDQAEANLANLNQRVAQANSVVGHEQQELENIRRQIEDAKNAMNAARARVDELQRALQAEQNELSNLPGLIASLEHQIADEEIRRDALKNQLRATQAKVEQLENTARQLEQKAASLTQQAQTAQNQLSQIQGQMNSLTQTLDRLKNDRNNQQNLINQLNARAEKISSEIQSLRYKISNLEKELTEKKQNYEKTEEKAQELDRRAREAVANHDPNARGLMRQAANMRQHANKAKAEYDQAAQELANARTELTKLESELPRITRELSNANRKITELDQQIASTKQQIGQLYSSYENAQRTEAQARAAATNATTDAQKARNDANETRKNAENLKRLISESDSKIQSLQNQRNQLRQRQNELKNVMNQQRSEIQQQQNLLSESVKRVQNLSAAFQNQRDRVEHVTGSLHRAVRDRDEAAAIVSDFARQTEMARRRLQDVAANLNNAIQVATSDGMNDGAIDGSQEGARQGSLVGSRDGNDAGNREGRENGTSDGIKRARDQGAEQGNQAGAAAGNQNGAVKGKETGLIEGKAKGNTDGLLAGYNAGYDRGEQLGYPEGSKAGLKMGGYEKGQAEGLNEGRQQASTEGYQKGEQDGDHKADEEFMNAELANSTLQNGYASDSSAFARDEWKNFNPHRRYAHPAIQQAYEKAYYDRFVQSAAESYDRSYSDAYRVSYNQAYAPAYQDFVNRPYQNEQKAAYDTAYSSAYDAAYKASYSAAYEAAFRPVYDQAYQVALPLRRAEGLAAGQKAGFERGKEEKYQSEIERGKEDGFKAGYAEVYPSAYDDGFKKGYTARVAFFTDNAVLRFDGGVLTDTNDDGVFAPGENLFFSVAMKNFGKSSQKSDVKIHVREATSGIEIFQNSDVLTKIPGQTRAVITQVGKLRLRKDAEIGSVQRMSVLVTDNGVMIGSFTVEMTVGYPLAVTSIDTAELVVAIRENSVSAAVQNLSTKTQEGISLRLVSSDGLATIRKGEMELGQIESGQIKSGTLSFSFGEDLAFRTMNFEIQIMQGDWLLGRRSFSVNTAKRWTFNPTSSGLALIAYPTVAQRVEEVEKLTGLNYDTWDIRVDGELSTETVMKYVGKTLIIPWVDASFNVASMNAVLGFLKAGGKVYAGVEPSLMNNWMMKLLQAYSKVMPKKDFAGINVHEKNFFWPAEFSWMIGYGPSFRNDSAQQLANRLMAFNVVSRSMGDKITAYLSALSSNKTALTSLARAAILKDLIKEMQDDKDVNGANYKKNRANLLLTAFINTTLSKTGESRRALLGLYPELEKARIDIGWFLSTRRARIKTVMKPLAKAYEKEMK